jgi:hypothetical protein
MVEAASPERLAHQIFQTLIHVFTIVPMGGV